MRSLIFIFSILLMGGTVAGQEVLRHEVAWNGPVAEVKWRRWMEATVFPEFTFSGSLSDAITHFMQESKKVTPDGRSIGGIIVRDGLASEKIRVNIKLRHRNALEIIDALCALSDASWTLSPYSIILSLTPMHAAEPQAENWLAKTKIAPPMTVPASVEAWQKQRGEIRATLNELLGDLPPRPPVSAFQIVSTEDKGSYTLETIQFDNVAGEIVKGLLFVPKKATAQSKAPAILYCHWHGGQYEIGKSELLGTNAVPVAPGPALAEAGYVVLGIDAPCFGERNGLGPDGPQQKGSAGEMTASKFHLWAGRTLWGMMIRDDLTALDYLCSRPEVDAQSIGVTGISMGATRSWWVMALDDRPRAAVCVGCMTRYEELIRAGMLKAHGIYYFVPGMLKHFDTEAVIALAAPRPMLFMTGDQDGGSPVEGVRHLGDIVGKVYDLHSSKGHFENVIYPGVGHVYLPEMWQRTLAWMEKWVKDGR